MVIENLLGDFEIPEVPEQQIEETEEMKESQRRYQEIIKKHKEVQM